VGCSGRVSGVMTWTMLRPTLRRAITREAARRGVDVATFFQSIGGVV
jgi:hypothetical protein